MEVKIKEIRNEILRQIHGDFIPIIPLTFFRKLKALTPTPEKVKALVIILDKGNTLGEKINQSIHKYQNENFDVNDLYELKKIFQEIKNLLVQEL